MYEFGTLIQIVIGIISIYIALYFALKQHNSYESFQEYEKKLNIIVFVAIYFFIFLYLAPYLFKLLKLLKNNFLISSDFVFSYITETILSILALILFFYEVYDTGIILLDNFFEIHNIIITVMYSILVEIGLLWLNYYMSLFIVNRLSESTYNFKICSIEFNILVYMMIPIVITIISIPCLMALRIINDGF